MSCARLIGLVLAAIIVTLPAMAKEEAVLRRMIDTDQAGDDEPAAESPAILPTVIVTERSARTILVTKPAVLRYRAESAPPARLAAERIGQDPDRLPRQGFVTDEAAEQ